MHIEDVAASKYTPTGIHATLWDYWIELRNEADGPIPFYSEFRPSRLASILPYLALSDYIDRDTQKIRLIGGGHDSLWPSEAIGGNLFDFVDPATAENRKRLYDQVISRPCACYFDETATTQAGRLIRYKGLFLPLLNSAGEPHIFIGAYDVLVEGYEMEQVSLEGVVSREQKQVILVNLLEEQA